MSMRKKVRARVKNLATIIAEGDSVSISGCGHRDIIVDGFMLENSGARCFCGRELTFSVCEEGAHWDYVLEVDDELHYFQAEWLEDIEAVFNWADVPIDTPVMVEDTIRAYFAGIYSGDDTYIQVWSHGKTSWSAQGELQVHLSIDSRLATPEDLE